MKHFETLGKLNVNKHTEKKNGLTYLSWAWAWAEVKKLYPSALYEVVKQGDGLPYVYDENTGYMVFTKVTIEELTHEMWLPVMDGANKAMKNKPYAYKTKYGEKTCLAATMFDINKTIMRCLTKNLAMFGLGLYIYAGEDLPEVEEPQKATETTQQPTELPYLTVEDKMYTTVINAVKSGKRDIAYVENKYKLTAVLKAELQGYEKAAKENK